MSRCVFLVTYTPLVKNRRGIEAAAVYGYPPFVDGSCRREPDLQHPHPSISALCRFRAFAPRLRSGDAVVYLTKKGRYFDERSRHWRLTAVLEVSQRFESHRAAAAWYANQGHTLPGNCWVSENPPLPLTHTIQPSEHASLEEWDRLYKIRAHRCGVFLACNALFVNLTAAAPIISESQMQTLFGRIPGTQNPPEISEHQLAAIMELTTTEKPT